MVELRLEEPVAGKVQVDPGIFAAIERGLEEANAGRAVPIDQFCNMIDQWNSSVPHDRLITSALMRRAAKPAILSKSRRKAWTPETGAVANRLQETDARSGSRG